MGNNATYLVDPVVEKDGWKLGPNQNPDVLEAIEAFKELRAKNPDKEYPDEDDFWMLVSPSGKCYSGSQNTLLKLIGGNDKADTAWRKRYA